LRNIEVLGAGTVWTQSDGYTAGRAKRGHVLQELAAAC
jgi:hypothetical protein